MRRERACPALSRMRGDHNRRYQPRATRSTSCEKTSSRETATSSFSSTGAHARCVQPPARPVRATYRALRPLAMVTRREHAGACCAELLVAAAERRAAPHAAARAPPAAACRPRRLCNRAHRRTRRRRCRTRTVGCAGIHGLVRTRAGPGTPLLPLAVQTTLRSRRSFKWSLI